MAVLDHYVTDKYLSALHSTYSDPSMAPTSGPEEAEMSTLGTLHHPPTLLDFLSSVPPPVTKLLIELQPMIVFLRWFAQSASWKGMAEQSWLLLFSWWALCLLLPSFVKFTIVPAIVIGPVLVKYIPRRSKPKVTLTTEQIIAQALMDLDIVQTLTPRFKIGDLLPWDFTWNERGRLLAFLTLPYLSVTYIVPVPVLIASFGSIFLTWRSPWFRTTRRIVTRSGHMRALYRHVVGFISGSYSVPLTFSKFKAPAAQVAPEPEKKIIHHRFLFIILENQRWWVGIDWTAALLPSERPSWCAPATATSLALATAGTANYAHTPILHPPLPPPSTFPLPPSTSVILPSPTGTGYVKRTAKWRWNDGSEWEVIVHKEGERASKRFRPPSISKTPQSGGGVVSPEGEEGIGSRFLKGQLSKLNLGNPGSSVSSSTSGLVAEPATTDGDEDEAKVLSEDDENLATDPEGWIYGDNKWENLSGKGGMGKFTRFRRWCRVAVLVEEEEPWDELLEADARQKPKFYQLEDTHAPGNTNGYNISSTPSASQQLQSPRRASEEVRHGRSLSIESRSTTSTSPERSLKDAKDKEPVKEGDGDQESSLRKRLKAVIKNAT